MDNLISLEMEQSVLGSLIVDNNICDKIDFINESLFSDTYHKSILKAMKKLRNNKKSIDIVTVTSILKENEVDLDIGYITKLCAISQPYSIDTHIEILKEKSKRRSIIEASNKLCCEIKSSEDINTLLYKFENYTNKITRCDEKIKDDVNSIADELLHFLESHKEIGIKFGIDFLDETIGGLYKGELTTIGAKSGVGKTALALQILRCCIKQGKKVLLISREMSRIQMLMRNISSKTGISTNKLKSKNIDSDEWGLIIRALGDLTDKNLLYINDDITTVSKIKRRLREVKPDLLIVDYLQLLTPEQNLGSREREVALLSRELKNITLDFDIPVIQLSQLNDEMKDIRPWGERPMRDSKAIYHDSNNVIYIHRPQGNDLYEAIENIGESKDNVLEAEKKGIFLVDIVVAKCRDGQTKFRHHCYNGGRLHFEKLIY